MSYVLPFGHSSSWHLRLTTTLHSFCSRPFSDSDPKLCARAYLNPSRRRCFQSTNQQRTFPSAAPLTTPFSVGQIDNGTVSSWWKICVHDQVATSQALQNKRINESKDEETKRKGLFLYVCSEVSSNPSTICSAICRAYVGLMVSEL